MWKPKTDNKTMPTRWPPNGKKHNIQGDKGHYWKGLWGGEDMRFLK